MEQDKRFDTADGYCVISNDKLIIVRHGEADNYWQKKQKRWNIKYYAFLFIAVLFVGFSILGLMGGVTYAALMVGVIGITLGYLYFRNRKYSFANKISRDSIFDMEFHQSYSGGFHSSFIVYFKDESGNARKRVISLPVTASRTAIEIAEAYEVMASEFIFIRFTHD